MIIESPKLGNREIKSFTNEIITIPEELEVMSHLQSPPKGKICWRIMTKEDGDKRVIWDSHSIEQINAAKDLFDRLCREGMEPYRVGMGGQKTAEKMTTFDATSEAIIFVPMKQVIGG